MSVKYLRFEDPDELVGHLSLLDISSIAVAVQTHDGQPLIIFNDTDQLESLLHQVKEAADQLPVDAEIISGQGFDPELVGGDTETQTIWVVESADGFAGQACILASERDEVAEKIERSTGKPARITPFHSNGGTS